jgi:hypothetical protein
MIDFGGNWMLTRLTAADWSEIGKEVMERKNDRFKMIKEARIEQHKELHDKYRADQERQLISIVNDCISLAAEIDFYRYWQEKLAASQFVKLPANSSYFTFERVREHLLRFGEIKSSRGDDHDIFHYTDARSSGCRYIVTNDGPLTRIANILHEKLSESPKAISFEKWIDSLAK